MENPFRKDTKPYLFFELANPDDLGFSRLVSIDEFKGKYKKLKMGNGGDWCRTDGSLGKKFLVHRKIEKNTIVGIQLFGLNNKSQIRKWIRHNIVAHYSKKRCVVLDVGNPEVDHKDGYRDDFEGMKKENQTLADFQPLSKAANNAKKEHCKKCRNSGERFDAKKMGYTVSTYKGDLTYRGTCVGCYWYDPYEFNSKISENYKNISDS